MKKFFNTYLSNDGAGVFAFLWILAAIFFIFFMVLKDV
jgi:hypothetical protein